MTTTRFHLTTTDRIDQFGGEPTHGNIVIDDGSYRSTVNFDHACYDIEFVEQCLDGDENVISYSSEIIEG